jgi:L-methionine (R)-S-oxide reductase
MIEYLTERKQMMNKKGRYERVYDQIKNLTGSTNHALSSMATINAILHFKMRDFFWTGFYLLQDDELLVGPYQGPVACLKLRKNTGVCWSAISKTEPVIVDNVDEFPGHIACDSRSKSEIAVPVFQNEKVVGVLDIDSEKLSNFDESDALYLSKIVTLIYP